MSNYTISKGADTIYFTTRSTVKYEPVPENEIMKILDIGLTVEPKDYRFFDDDKDYPALVFIDDMVYAYSFPDMVVRPASYYAGRKLIPYAERQKSRDIIRSICTMIKTELQFGNTDDMQPKHDSFPNEKALIEEQEEASEETTEEQM